MKTKTLPTLLLLFVTFQVTAQKLLENLGSNLNTSYSEIRPTISADGKTLFFVVEGNPKNTMYATDKHAQDVWFSELGNDGNWSKAKQCASPINQKNDNAVFWSSPDGSKLLIRGVYKNGKFEKRGFSFIHKIINTENIVSWSSPEELKIKGYSSMSVDKYAGGSMSTDGKTLLLYFSEEKNSFLNDIYVSRLQNDGEWSAPKKIEGDINQDDYDEISPYLASDGVTLYFASDRPGGFGEYDVWMSKRLDDTWMNWTAPVNMGDSVNTAKWDAYFTIDAKGEYGYLASTSSSLGASDLFKVKLNNANKPSSVVMLYGKVYSAENNEEIIPGLHLEVNTIKDGKENQFINDPTRSDSSTSEYNSSYKIVFPYGNVYSIKASGEGYQSHVDTLDFSVVAPYKELHQDIFIQKLKKQLANNGVDTSKSLSISTASASVDTSSRSNISVEKDFVSSKISTSKNIDSINNRKRQDLSKGDIIVINNILFDFAKSSLKKSSYKELRKVVQLLKNNPNVTIELSAHTDNIGSDKYNLKLSKARAKSSSNYLISKGISYKRIQSKGYGERKPIASNKTSVGRKLNRRVEIKVIKK